MCGILGIINKRGVELDQPKCRRALATLNWRGPDSSITYFPENHIFLGQTILSLTGKVIPGDGSHLWSPKKSKYLCFNGEVYNYRAIYEKFEKDQYDFSLTETTDSQVLIRLLEKYKIEDIYDELDGMFTFSVYSPEEKTIKLTRDIQGEKLLYIYEDNDYYIFSSQINTIESFLGKLDIDHSTLQNYFHTRHGMFFNNSIFKNVSQISPGETRKLCLNSMKWETTQKKFLGNLVSPETMEENNKKSLEDLVDELDCLLSDNTKEMIPVDRGFSSVLSGGIDSSLLSYYVNQYRPINLVAINHKGKDLISHDLIGFEKNLDRKVNLIHVSREDYASLIPFAQSVLSSPLLSHSFIGQLIQSKEVRHNGSVVLFGGEAADELFGGYDCYMEEIKTGSEFCPSKYSNFSATELEFKNKPEPSYAHDLKQSWRDCLDTYSHIEDIDSRTRLAMMLSDLYNQVSSVGLRGADLMSLAFSVETRSIFLRKEIIRFALNLPIWAKIDSSQTDERFKTKIILKKVFEKKFGADLILPKQGFSGFPNESQAYLGKAIDFLVWDELKITKPTDTNELSRETMWKLINTEFFLRGREI